MRAVRSLSFSLVLSATLLLGACGPPEIEMRAAELALAEARWAEAPGYAPEAWREATAAMVAADSELATQATESRLSRDYSEALERLAEVEEKARAATSLAAQAKARARQKARRALADARQGLVATTELLDRVAQCPEGSGAAADELELYEDRFDALRFEYRRAELALGSDDPFLAAELGHAVSRKAAPLSAELLASERRVRCRHPLTSAE